MNFTPTHLTPDGTPVEIDARYGTARTRTGRDTAWSAEELIPLGSAEAQEILAEITGQDETAAVTAATEDRAWMARRYLATEDARSTLATAVLEALSYGQIPWDVRKVLQQAMAQAQEDLAAL